MRHNSFWILLYTFSFITSIKTNCCIIKAAVQLFSIDCAVIMLVIQSGASNLLYVLYKSWR